MPRLDSNLNNDTNVHTMNCICDKQRFDRAPFGYAVILMGVEHAISRASILFVTRNRGTLVITNDKSQNYTKQKFDSTLKLTSPLISSNLIIQGESEFELFLETMLSVAGI